MTDGSRADLALVERGLARSRAVARELIAAGAVTLNGTVLLKPSVKVAAEHNLQVEGEVSPWVGRAAYKLLAALEAFGPGGLSVAGRRCIDVGASTGGFTQVLLAHGATEVVALDVGHGQLVAEVAADPRVIERSGTNVREVAADELGGAAELVVSDLSFISLVLVMPQLRALTRAGGDLVVLVKPQFEVGRERLGRTGVVRSGQQRAESVRKVLQAADAQGLNPHGLVTSPVVGGTGNREYLLWLRDATAGMMSAMDLTEQLTAIERGSTP